MPSISIIRADRSTHSLDYQSGDILMELLVDNDFDEIAAVCGGSCSCATCHIHVLTGAQDLQEMEEDESQLLDLLDEYRPEQSRLSCQIELSEDNDGMEIQLLENS